jgi:hypothetical protein
VKAKPTEATSPALRIARRSSLKAIAGAFAGLILPNMVGAQSSGQLPFDQWIAEFGAKATAH